MNRMSQKAAYPYIIWIVGFIIIPILYIFSYAVHDENGLTLKYVLSILWTVHRKPLFLSLYLAFICVVVCLIISIPLAIILRQVQSRIVIFLFMLPMWMNTILSILAWKLLLAPRGLISHFLPSVSILNTVFATELGMIYDLLPFAIIPIHTAFAAIDEDVIRCAWDLGANRWQVFCKVMLPLARDGIVSAIVMVFVPALTSFVVSDMLGGGKVMLIGNVIEQEFTNLMDWHLGAGLSLVLMVFVLLSTFILDENEKNEYE